MDLLYETLSRAERSGQFPAFSWDRSPLRGKTRLRKGPLSWHHSLSHLWWWGKEGILKKQHRPEGLTRVREPWKLWARRAPSLRFEESSCCQATRCRCTRTSLLFYHRFFQQAAQDELVFRLFCKINPSEPIRTSHSVRLTYVAHVRLNYLGCQVWSFSEKQNSSL